MYLRQALFRFRRLCRLGLPPNVVAKMSVPVESERLARGMWTYVHVSLVSGSHLLGVLFA